jgi:dTDP-4-amino-4,6-dideoxygalactose transaminase
MAGHGVLMRPTPLPEAGAAPLPAAGQQCPAPKSAPLPRGPVLGWASFGGARSADVPAVADLPHRLLVTSGRAALHAALQQLQLSPGSVVLVPSYHCPTMVAPIVRAGLTPCFYAIGDDGLPQLDRLDEAQGTTPAGALVVAHLFGLPQDLAAVRAWCDRHGVPLLEDCAHSFFGMAGSRPVGTWGDFATASITKFLPVPELGLLASAHRPLKPMPLARQGARAQLKGWVDALETAAHFDRPAGLAATLRGLQALKNAGKGRNAPQPAGATEQSADPMMSACDMGRVDAAPLHLSGWLYRHLPLQRVVQRRQQNFDRLSDALAGLPGTRLLMPRRASTHAPYAVPLWVDDAERIYHPLRARGLPVMRWDRLWPGTPHAAHDAGPRWSTHVLQLPCHQDLSARDVDHMAQQLQRCLRP